MIRQFHIFIISSLFFLGVLISVVSASADKWKQSDWSGGGSQLFWQDSTKFLFGKRISGIIIDYSLVLEYHENWLAVQQFPNATDVYAIRKGSDGSILSCLGDFTGNYHLYRSVDEGLNWQSIPLRDGHDFDVWNVVWDGILVDGIIYVTIQYHGGPDRGIIDKTDDLGNSWFNLYREDNTRIYRLYKFGSVLIGIGTPGVVRTTNEGEDWDSVSLGSDVGSDIIKADDGSLYLCTKGQGKVFTSTDVGINWIEIVNLPNATNVYALSQTPDSTLFAATGPNGIVYRTDGDSYNWVAVSEIPLASDVTAIISDSTGKIYVATTCLDDTARIFMSEDKGDSWQNLGILVDVDTIYSLIKLSSGHILAATGPNGTLFKGPCNYSSGYLLSSLYNSGTDNGSVEYGAISWDDIENEQDIVVRVRTFPPGIDSVTLDSLARDTLWL
ncbi:hypothetical protein KAX35_09205, partial [candidate division WOR-3 bacterium]|nr:hypothetical protein [candidate division WOR-3 bacterium]